MRNKLRSYLVKSIFMMHNLYFKPCGPPCLKLSYHVYGHRYHSPKLSKNKGSLLLGKVVDFHHIISQAMMRIQTTLH